MALVLATGSRDVAADTVDDAFRIWHARVLRNRLPQPEKAAVMLVALKRVARMTRNGADAPQGFRLRTAPLDDGHRRTLREFRSLPLAERSAVVLVRHLGWDQAVAAAATGYAPGSLDTVIESAVAGLGASLGVDAADAATLLDHALAAESEGLREPLSRAAGMKSAGLVQRFGRAIGGVGLSVVVAIGLFAGISALDLGSDPIESQVAQTLGTSPTGSTATVPVITGPTTLTEARFEWVNGGLPIAPNSGDIRSVSAAGSDIVIVGMEYTNRPQAIVARSSDGIDWELLGAPFVGDGDISGVAAADGLFVAAGNRWEGEFGNTASVWTSTDGFDWLEIPLPIADRGTIAGVEVRVHNWVQRVDIVDGDIMAVVQSNAELDDRLLGALIPGGFPGGGWGTGPDGIQIFDQGGRATFIGWDELGLTDEEVALISQAGSIIVSSDEGQTWTSTALPGRGNVMSVASGGGVTAVVVADLFGPELWMRDGEEWAVNDVGLSPVAVSSFGGALFATGVDETGASAVWRSTDGRAWDTVLDGIEGGQLQMNAGDSAIMLWGVPGNPGFARPVELEIDGFTVEFFLTGGIRVRDPETGDVVAEFSQERVFQSGNAYVVEDADGEPILELSPDALEIVFTREEFIGDEPFGQATTLYVSTNGIDWAKIETGGDLPEFFYAFTGAPVGDGVALLGWDQRGEGQQLWIGTPAS